MAYGRAGNMDEEMRRFEMELAGGNSQNGHFPSSSYQQSSNGFQTPVSSVASAPVRFIPHQLQRNRATTQTQQQSQQQQPFMVHAPPQPAQITSSYSFPTLFNPQLVPSMFPRMASQQVQSATGQLRTMIQPNVLQVSANKAMLDAQKAMAMQTKEPPVMGPQITPKAIEDKALSNKAKKKIKYIRTAGGEIWEDNGLVEWDPNDYRVFCGDLGNEVNDEALARAFRKYPSFQKAKIIRDKKSNKSKGYGFVSFKDPNDFVRAMKEMNGKYVGNRPIKLRKSTWKDRQLDVSKKRVREKQKLGLRV